MSLTNYAESATLNSIFGKTSDFGALASAPTIYLGVLTADPTDAGTQTSEPGTAGAYARITTAASDWSTSASGTALSNTSILSFAESTAAWSTGATELAYFALFDALTGGNMIGSAALTTNRTVNATGVTLSFAVGALTVSLD